MWPGRRRSSRRGPSSCCNCAAGIAAERLLREGARVVVIKLGARDAFVYDGTRRDVVPGIRVEAVDTTAAGALSVTRHRAQPPMPFRAEVDEAVRSP